MKILVACKRAVDYRVRIRVRSDGSGVELNNVKMSMNPFDEIAVEEAVRLKEKGLATEIIVVSIGVVACQEILRAGLAMGADRAIHVDTDQSLEPLAVAKVLKQLVTREQCQLVLLGKQAIDDDYNQTGQMLAALLNWPQMTFASEIQLQDQTLTVVREVDGGLQTLRCTLPAVVTTDLRLNTPRYASLPNIMKAKSKPLSSEPLAQMGLDTQPHLTTLKVSEPSQRTAGIKVQDVGELIAKLRTAKVIE